jgi:hypothetical protein
MPIDVSGNKWMTTEAMIMEGLLRSAQIIKLKFPNLE